MMQGDETKSVQSSRSGLYMQAPIYRLTRSWALLSPAQLPGQIDISLALLFLLGGLLTRNINRDTYGFSLPNKGTIV
jgi:hypothetical protein